MNKKIVIMIIFALLVSFTTVFLIFTAVNDMTKEDETVIVAVAKENIKAGIIMKSDMYEYVEIPKSEYIPMYIKKTDKELKGVEVKENIYKGEKILSTRIGTFTVINDENADDEKIFNDTGLRRMTYTAQGVQNLAGQLKAGDKIDFWLRYKLQDKENKDTIVVVDKILSNVSVVKALNSNSQEIKNKNEASTTIELLLEQEQIQEFIKWKDLGKITLVKVPPNINVDKEKEITRKKMSMNELIWDVLSMEENEMNKNDIKKMKIKKKILINTLLMKMKTSINNNKVSVLKQRLFFTFKI